MRGSAALNKKQAQALSRSTLEVIAERVGVSVATVSRALNNMPGVGEAKRQQIIAVAKELNYHPNAIARSLQSQRTNTIAFLAEVDDRPTADLLFFKDFVTALAERCAARGMDLLIHPAKLGGEKMPDLGRILRAGRADGLILSDTRCDDQRIRYLLAQGLPFVSFGRTSITQTFSYVDIDGELGMYAATRHLIQRGHRRISFLGLPPEFRCTVDRFEGYQRALREYGLALHPDYVVQGLTNESEADVAMERLLSLPEPPTAFAVASDMLAVYAINVALQRGLYAGRDYAITGFDNVPLARHTNPPLTTVHQPLDQVCDALIMLLQRVIENTSEVHHVLIKPELIVRETS